MSSSKTILNAVQQSLKKRQKVGYPAIPLFENPDVDLLAIFKNNLELAGATWYEIDSVEKAKDIMRTKLPDAKVICSATDVWNGNKDLGSVVNPKDLEDVDLGVLRADFGVAEMGMVWLTEKNLKVNSIGFLSQHLAILLDPKRITENMHSAYKLVDLKAHSYGCFMMGPSATADIGATLVHGAQGARSLTLFLFPE